MGDISYDETVAALASEGLVDPSPAAPAESGEPSAGEQGGLLNGGLGTAGTALVAGVIGSKLTGGKSTGSPVADVVATVADSAAKDDAAPKAKSSSGKPGVLDKIGSIPGAAASAMKGTVQSILEEFVGTAGGSGDLGTEFSKAMQDISSKDKKSRPLPSISNILPDEAKSVSSFIPGLGG